MWQAANRGADIRRYTPAEAVDLAEHRAVWLRHHVDGRRLSWLDSGEVDSLGWGVASDVSATFGGLPHVERTLNWVRIAARFPVRVLLDAPPDDLMRYGATAVIVIEK